MKFMREPFSEVASVRVRASVKVRPAEPVRVKPASRVAASMILSKSMVSFTRSAFSMLVIEFPVPLASKETPVMAPVASMSQSEESMATVSPPSPRATMPFAASVPLAVSVPASVKPPATVKSVPTLPMLVMMLVPASSVPAKVKAPRVSVALSKVIPPLAATADEKVAPAPVNVVVEAVPMVPEVVIVSTPTSIEPKPEVIEPESRAPVPVMAVATASLVSTRAASLPSRRSSSAEEMVVAPVVMSFEPMDKAATMSGSETSMATVVAADGAIVSPAPSESLNTEIKPSAETVKYVNEMVAVVPSRSFEPIVMSPPAGASARSVAPVVDMEPSAYVVDVPMVRPESE